VDANTARSHRLSSQRDPRVIVEGVSADRTGSSVALCPEGHVLLVCEHCGERTCMDWNDWWPHREHLSKLEHVGCPLASGRVLQ
jgi:hypothetical protein